LDSLLRGYTAALKRGMDPKKFHGYPTYNKTYEKCREVLRAAREHNVCVVYMMASDLNNEFKTSSIVRTILSRFYPGISVSYDKIMEDFKRLCLCPEEQDILMEYVAIDFGRRGMPGVVFLESSKISDILETAGVKKLILIGEEAGVCLFDISKYFKRKGFEELYRIDECIIWESIQMKENADPESVGKEGRFKDMTTKLIPTRLKALLS